MHVTLARPSTFAFHGCHSGGTLPAAAPEALRVESIAQRGQRLVSARPPCALLYFLLELLHLAELQDGGGAGPPRRQATLWYAEWRLALHCGVLARSPAPRTWSSSR